MGVQPITIPKSLAYVLNTAGDKSGVDFDYLLKTAMRESSLDPEAKAPSSSAVGLFQFLDSTWLQVMKEEGPRLGYQKYADAITRTADGDYTIRDRALRAEVLKLRENPQVAADMAAAFTRSNGEYLQAKFGRMPSPGELYIAHFLGPQGAEKLFDAGLKDPDQIAARLFPRQARANPRIFYADGRARTIREVYKALVAQHDGIVAAPDPGDLDPKFVAQQIASNQQGKVGGRAGTDVPSRIGPTDMSFTTMFSTETGPGGPPHPLVAQGGVSPLAAIDSVLEPEGQGDNSDPATALAYAPLPAPAPLVSGGAPAVPETTGATIDLLPPQPSPPADQPPAPRVLLSPGVTPNPAFFTQLVSQN